MNVFRMVGEENRVDSVEEGFRARNVEALGDTEGGNVLRETSALT